MKILKAFFISAVVILINGLSNAEIKDIKNNEIDLCRVTKITTNDYEPESFEPSNNLLRKDGQVLISCKEKIIIYGKVIDKNCLPVQDAKIYIWQTDCNGKYPYKPLKDVVDKRLISLNSRATSTGNGTAITNNNGEFFFITTEPEAIHGLKPHINVRVKYSSFGSLQSRLTLAEGELSSPDKLERLQSLYKVKMEQTPVYYFEIVLPTSGARDYYIPD